MQTLSFKYVYTERRDIVIIILDSCSWPEDQALRVRLCIFICSPSTHMPGRYRNLDQQCHLPYILASLSCYHSMTYFPELLKMSLDKKAPWSESASELYRRSDRRLSATLVPIFADRECHLVSATDPYGRILGFLERSRYFFFQVAPQLYSRGVVDPVLGCRPRGSCSIPGATRFSEKYSVWNGVHSAS
jgi:hypothetical protein